MDNNKKINFKVYASNERNEALNEAYNLFIETFLEYSERNNLSEEQILNFKEKIRDAYLYKRCSYLLDDKIQGFAEYLSNVLSFALTNSITKNEVKKDDELKLFYCNANRRYICH